MSTQIPSLTLARRLARMAGGVIVAFVAFAASAQSLRDLRPPKSPLVLEQQGSFFVGGREVHTDAAGFQPPDVLEAYNEGEHTIDQMYVQFQVPLAFRKRVPLVFMHGCCLSAKTWETTPDGRMGWYEYFTRKGHATYLAEQVGRARSGFNATIYNEVHSGQVAASSQPQIYIGTKQFAWDIFRLGPRVGEFWPDTQFPANHMFEFSKQIIPDLFLTLVPDLFGETTNPVTDIPTTTHLATLARELKGAVLVGHSQSSGFPLKAALKDPKGVRGIIGLETGCFSTLTPQHIQILKKIPILVMAGDHYTVPQPPPECVTQMAQINAAGGDMTFIHLPAIGIKGNTHMFMQDRNNLQVADIIDRWIERHVEERRGGYGH